MTAKKIPTAILISGNGTNMEALINAAKDPSFPAEISLVISNRPAAKGIEIAKSKGVPVEVIDHKAFEAREDFDEAINGALKNVSADLVCNAGFKRLLTKGFVDKWHNRQLNIHPSLLPAFKGLNTHQCALDANVKIAGCTVHYVRFEMDSGPIIAQAAVPVLPDDTAESLKARVLKAEHQIYPAALKLVASQKVRVSGEKVIFKDSFPAGEALISPLLP